MMKRFFVLFLAICCLLALTAPAFAETEADPVPEIVPEDELVPEEENLPPYPVELLQGTTHIQTMQITATVRENGTASVTLLIYLSFASPVQELRFCLPDGASGESVEGRTFDTVSENGVQWITLKSQDGFLGTQTFTLSYDVKDFVSQQEESQQMALPLLAPQDYAVASLQINVTMPADFDSKVQFSGAYEGDQLQDLMSVSSQGSSISALVTTMLRDHDAVTLNMELPADYFTGSHGASAFATVMLILVLLFSVLAAVYWFCFLRNRPLRVQARTLPPDGVNPGDVPFLLSGGNADFNMLISHWANLGYLSFLVTADGHVVLHRRMDMGNERRDYERKLFAMLFGDGDQCDGASLRYKKVGEKAMSIIPRYWGRRLYHKASGNPSISRFLCCFACGLAMMLAMDAMAPATLHGLFLPVGFVAGVSLCWLMLAGFSAYYLFDWMRVGIGLGSGILLLVLGAAGSASTAMLPALIVSVFVGWQTIRGGQRSAYGEQVLAQTLGFRRFLYNASEHSILQMIRRDPQYFYKMLPYAQAMGLGRRFVGLFHDITLEPCPWYEAAEGAPRSVAAFYAHYCESLEMLNVSIRK